MAKFAKRKSDRSALENRIVRGGMIGMEAWLDIAVQEAEGLAPVDTSRLAKSIHKDPASPFEMEPLVFAGLFGTNVEYARAHEYGSGIHASDPAERELILIEAGFWTGKSDKKALAFFWPGGPTDHPAYDPETGKFIMRRVYHPGVPAANQGKGYLRPAAANTLEEGKRLVVLAITAEMRKAV